MWAAVLLTVLAAAGNNIGKVLQKQGTKGLPHLSFNLKVVHSYLLSRIWISGVIIDVLGGLLMLKAVSEAPVSVVQPVSGCGLAVLAVFSHFYLRESMQPLDWLAVVMAAAGTIGVGVTGEEQKNSEVSVPRLIIFMLSLSLLFVVLNWWMRSGKHHRRLHDTPNSPISGISASHMEVMEEIATGLQAGVWFGLSAALCKLGFLLSEHNESTIYIPFGITASICCSTGGFFCQTRGLKDGRAVVVSTCAAVASIVTGVIVGFLALGESLPVSSYARFLLCLGWFFIVMGIILLLASEKVGRSLPRSLRRLLRAKSTLQQRPFPNFTRISPLVSRRDSNGSITVPILGPQIKSKSPPRYI